MVKKNLVKSALLTLVLLLGLQLQAQIFQRSNLSDTIDVVNYHLYLDITDPASQTISGRAGIRFTSPVSSLSMLTLELKQLQVDSVQFEDNTDLPFTHTGERLLIGLPGPVFPGDTTLVWVYYHGQPFHEAWGGFHFAGSYAFNLGVGFESIPHNLGKTWFPCVDDFVDRAFYDYHIRVSDQHTAVCGGMLQSVEPQPDNTLVFNWESERTLPTYLASVAVGTYALVTDSVETARGTIPVTYYVRPSDTTRARGSFVNLPEITGIYEEAFGPYPFQRIGITGTALGAMEHAENIFYPHSSINGNLSYEWLYAHELSHMWFGDQVTCSSDADMWLNEGWARWCETYYREKLYGTAEAIANFRPLLRDVLQYMHTKEGGYRPLSPMPPEYTYGDNVYDKGAVKTQALRGYLGDTLFFGGVKAYLEAFAYSPASSTDLRDFLTQYTGIDMSGFFDFHIFGPGYNQFSVDSFRVVPAGNEYDVEIFLRQRLKGTATYAHNIRLEVTCIDNNWQMATRRIGFEGPHGQVVVRVPFVPAFIMSDYHEMAADATTDGVKTIKTAGLYDYADTFFKLDVTQVSDSAFVRVTHNWVPPDSLHTPVEGLTLSDYRYWTIEGIFPEGFTATGRFLYNRNTYLDNNLIVNAADSLVILYRPDAATDWQPIPFTRIGPWQIGTLYVTPLRPGDYTLAIWDELYVGTSQSETKNGALRIYPNPAGDSVTFETDQGAGAVLTVNDTSGRVVFSDRFSKGSSPLRWDSKGVANGTYIVTLKTAGRSYTEKLIISH